MHNIAGPGIDDNGSVYSNESNYFTIPYRSFIPEGVEGLFVAGRCISGTHIAHSAYRIMPICLNMGQGVGTAAAYCSGHNINPREAKVEEIQNMLMKQGVKI